MGASGYCSAEVSAHACLIHFLLAARLGTVGLRNLRGRGHWQGGGQNQGRAIGPLHPQVYLWFLLQTEVPGLCVFLTSPNGWLWGSPPDPAGTAVGFWGLCPPVSRNHRPRRLGGAPTCECLETQCRSTFRTRLVAALRITNSLSPFLWSGGKPGGRHGRGDRGPEMALQGFWAMG